MSNYENSIKFKDLKRISEFLDKGDEESFVNYINTFKGNNIYEKFRNILKIWSHDVSYTLTLNSDKPVNVSMDYFLKEFPDDIDLYTILEKDFFKIGIDIPDKFDIIDNNIIPIYSIIKYISINDISINLSNLEKYEKTLIIDKIPPKMYNEILNSVVYHEKNTIRFQNQNLNFIKFNFLSNEPYLFLKGLFSGYSGDYFRDVIYQLSKKIDGNILINSTILDIDYYIEKYSSEVKSQNDSLTL